MKRTLRVGLAFTNKLFADEFSGNVNAISTEVATWVTEANLLYNAQLNFELEVAAIVVSDGTEAWDNYATADKGECTRHWTPSFLSNGTESGGKQKKF